MINSSLFLSNIGSSGHNIENCEQTNARFKLLSFNIHVHEVSFRTESVMLYIFNSLLYLSPTVFEIGTLVLNFLQGGVVNGLNLYNHITIIRYHFYDYSSSRSAIKRMVPDFSVYPGYTHTM